MTVSLPPALDKFVSRMLATGRYTDEGEIMREALRLLERREQGEPVELETALLEGVRSPHRPYDSRVLDSIRAAATHGMS